MLARGRALYKELVSIAVSEGYQLTESALRLLERCEDPPAVLMNVISKLRAEEPMAVVIDLQHVKHVAGVDVQEPLVEQPVKQEEKGEEIDAAQYAANYRVIQLCGDDTRIEGTIDEFIQYFRSRYYKLRRIIERRRDTFIPVSELSNLQDGREASIVAMVMERQEGSKALILTCDDPSGTVRVAVPKSNNGLYEQAENILNDQVIGLKLRRSNSIFIAQDIYFPDIEIRRRDKDLGNIPQLYACLISDIHVGSKKFREDLFERFLDWLNRGRDGVVRRLKYVVVNGDLIDGIGVYPGQDKELATTDVEEQLRMAAKLLGEIPHHIEVIVCPGNHEPVRKALPQPALQQRHKSILTEHRAITFGTNPAHLVVEGRRITVYHGQGLEEIIQSLPNISYSTLRENMDRVMLALIKARHLAPSYGENTQLMPLSDDPLVIEEPPDLLHTGHIHIAHTTSYRGVQLVNSGTWQDQTGFQKSLGLEPTIGTAVLLELSTMRATVRYFS